MLIVLLWKFEKMNKILNLILLLLISFPTFSQESHKKPYIPLETEIEITITSVDSTSLKYYTIYYFDYKRKRNGSFIDGKENITLKPDNMEITFCRKYSFKMNDGTSIRSGRGLLGEMYIDEELMLNFDEFSHEPTLRICQIKN